MHKEIMSDELIERRIKATSRDQYGQIKLINCTLGNLFPTQEKEVEEFLLNSKKYELSTYGGKCGIFKAISLR